MKKPVFLIVAIVVVAGIGAAAWFLLSGGASTRAVDRAAEVGEMPAAIAVGARAPAGARRAAELTETAGPAPAKKLPPPPSNGESTVTGRIVDAATHGGIAQAAIVLRHPEGEYAVTGESQADGGFVLARVPGVVGARIFVSAPGYGPRVLRDVHVPPHDKLDVGAIELTRGLPIRGRVVASLGVPISGAQVDLIESPIAGGEYSRTMIQTFRELRQDDEALDQAITAADGTFAFACAAPGSYVVAARKPGWQLRFSKVVTIAPAAAPPRVEICLVESKQLRGIVRDEAGVPIAGADLAGLESDPESLFIPKSQKTTTGADGRFGFSSFGDGPIWLIVRAAGHAVASRANLHTGQDPIEIELMKGARIEGRVIDQTSGSGLAGAVVVAYQFGGRVAIEETRSGVDGAYVLEGGPAGPRVGVFAKLPGYTMATMVEAMHSKEQHGALQFLRPKEDFPSGATIHRDLPMIAGGSVSGRVIDEATSEGIAGAEIVIRCRGLIDYMGVADPVLSRSGPDGVFTVASVGAGTVSVAARADAYLAMVDPKPEGEDPWLAQFMEGLGVEVPPGGAVTNLVVRLRRGVQLDVLVTDADRAPIPGASVTWMKHDDDPFPMYGQKKRPRAIVTDGSGKAHLVGLAAEAGIIVAVRHPDFPAGGHVTVDTAPAPDHPVTVVLQRAASLAGVLLDVDGKPVPRREIVYSPSENDVTNAFGESFLSGRSVMTDSEGRFLVENLPSGPGTFSLGYLMGSHDENGETSEPEECLDPAQISVTLGVGKREQVTLQLVRTQTISGTAFDAAGKPLANVQIEGARPGTEEVEMFFAESGKDGTYRLKGMPPGSYQLEATAPPVSETEEPEVLKRLVRAGSTNVEFRFTKGGTGK